MCWCCCGQCTEECDTVCASIKYNYTSLHQLLRLSGNIKEKWEKTIQFTHCFLSLLFYFSRASLCPFLLYNLYNISMNCGKFSFSSPFPCLFLLIPSPTVEAFTLDGSLPVCKYFTVHLFFSNYKKMFQGNLYKSPYYVSHLVWVTLFPKSIERTNYGSLS